MSTLVTRPEALALDDAPPRKRWTREECARLEESGLLDGQHFELIEGELYNKMGKKRPHSIASTLVRNWLIKTFGGSIVETETSIDVAPQDNPTSEPEPDLIVLNKPTWEFDANPKPADIRLAVEISDTTLRFDAQLKSGLYARAGIAEYWVLDVAARRLVIHRDPVNGIYQSVSQYVERDLAISGVVSEPFPVSALFSHNAIA